LRAILRARRGELLAVRICAVIPTLNAGDDLTSCLASLAEADEIIVADGGSNDATLAISRAAGATIVASERGRGVQLAKGASAASGDALLFVHADTHLAPGWRALAERHLESSNRPACFRLKLDDPAWQARLIERAVAVRTRLAGLPYGDQGLLISREAYDASGGFRPLVLMEDVDLLRRLARPVTLDGYALTSAERWRRDGWARRTLRNLTCLSLWRLGVSPDRIARLYA
jgi:rSAM/selenodomain-associated transferase 2